MLRAVVLAGFAVLIVATAAGPAAAKSPPACWKTLINDWYDGRIDGIYPIHCYRDALKHLPTDVDTYSSARDDIKQALQKRLTQGSGAGTGTTGTTGAGGSSNSGGGGKSGGGQNGGGKGGGGGNASGPVNDVLSAGNPTHADSLPIPLIVLGAVAFALMAAGAAGFLARRTRMRKLQLASAAAHPPQPAGPPPKKP